MSEAHAHQLGLQLVEGLVDLVGVFEVGRPVGVQDRGQAILAAGDVGGLADRVCEHLPLAGVEPARGLGAPGGRDPFGADFGDDIEVTAAQRL